MSKTKGKPVGTCHVLLVGINTLDFPPKRFLLKIAMQETFLLLAGNIHTHPSKTSPKEIHFKNKSLIMLQDS